MPQKRFVAMVGHLEANLGDPDTERTAYFQGVIDLAETCRKHGPLALLTSRRAGMVRLLRNAFTASIVFWQMDKL